MTHWQGSHSAFILQPSAFLLLVLLAQPAAALEPAPVYPEHQDLSYYLDADGGRHAVDSVTDWNIRRQHILTHMQTVMGPLPLPEHPVPLDVRILEEVAVGSLARQKISYHTDSRHRVSAYLFLPSEGVKPAPAVLCLQQTTKNGKQEPAGLLGKPSLHCALHLANRGYVTLAPDYPSFGEYDHDFGRDGYVSGTMKAVYDNV